MSNPQKGKRYTASEPDAMRLKTEISSVFSEMPRGEMAAEPAAGTDTSGTQMPTGDMNGGGGMGLTAGEMPSGQMSGAAPTASPGSIAIGNTGQMSGLTESEMPGGQMTSALSAADNGLTVTAMPTGQIQAGAQADKDAPDVFPVLEITGEWLLTLSPTSLKKSRGN